MHHVIERWLSASPKFRNASGCLLIALSLLISWGAVAVAMPDFVPVGSSIADELAEVKVRLQRIPPRLALNAHLAVLQQREVPGVFSAVAFCKQHAVTFISWQPSPRGGDLVMEAQWENLPALFGHLRPYWLRVAAFTLEKLEGRLRLSLQLESVDAN